jgi:hypothetical protein
MIANDASAPDSRDASSKPASPLSGEDQERICRCAGRQPTASYAGT